MYAVIRTGGKQYKVTEGDQIVVEKLLAEAGEDVTFGDVLMLSDGDKLLVGEPVVEGACVYGEVVEQRRGKKILIFKKRQRSTYRRKKGHRQYETVVNIIDVSADGSRKDVMATFEDTPAMELPEENVSDELTEDSSIAFPDEQTVEVAGETENAKDDSGVLESVDESGEQVEETNSGVQDENNLETASDSHELSGKEESEPEIVPSGSKEETKSESA